MACWKLEPNLFWVIRRVFRQPQAETGLARWGCFCRDKKDLVRIVVMLWSVMLDDVKDEAEENGTEKRAATVHEASHSFVCACSNAT